MDKKESLFQKIKEHPIKSFGKAMQLVLLIIVTALSFLIGVGAPIFSVLYVIVIIIVAVFNFATLLATWYLYLIAIVGGVVAINLMSLAFSGLLAGARENLTISVFGIEEQGVNAEEVPAVCASSFDPKETALLELERKFDANLITAEEYEKQKNDIEKNL